MGREAKCMAETADWNGMGRLQLETDQLIFRGAKRTVVPLTEIRSARAESGWLMIEHHGITDRYDLGAAAASWARAITSPRTRIDKLDVKPTSRVIIAGVDDADFLEELRARAPHSTTDAGTPVDLAFLRVEGVADLDALSSLREAIVPHGAIWIVHPKGHAELKHEPIVAAAKRAGLVDVKTARFSETHTALKLMIPRVMREGGRSRG
jgi:hypothetical protein